VDHPLSISDGSLGNPLWPRHFGAFFLRRVRCRRRSGGYGVIVGGFDPPAAGGRCQLRVKHRVLDRAMPESVLNGAGVMAGVGQGVAAGNRSRRARLCA